MRQKSGVDAVFAKALSRSDGSVARVYVNGVTVEADATTRIRPGSRVVFGSMLDDEGEPYVRFAFDLFAFGFDADKAEATKPPPSPAAEAAEDRAKEPAAPPPPKAKAKAIDLDVRQDSDDESWHETYSDMAAHAAMLDERDAYRRLEIDQIYETTIDDKDNGLHKRIQHQAYAYDDNEADLLGVCDVGCMAWPLGGGGGGDDDDAGAPES